MNSKHSFNNPQPAVLNPLQGSAPPPVYHHSPVHSPVPTTPLPSTNARTPHPVPISILTDNPAFVHCPHCNTYGMTETKTKCGLCTWISVCVFCFFSCGVFSWIPCLIDSCMDVEQNCSNCGNTLSVYKRI